VYPPPESDSLSSEGFEKFVFPIALLAAAGTDSALTLGMLLGGYCSEKSWLYASLSVVYFS
tara:strand:+ start:346 stop:528 length:183 start_codon:yes stop_codon:yes gene_type:complete